MKFEGRRVEETLDEEYEYPVRSPMPQNTCHKTHTWFSMRLSVAALAGLLALCSGDAVELNGKNFDKKVFGKKSAFVKFLAPWVCG